MQKMLYVEDDLSLIDGLQYTLEASGYMVDNIRKIDGNIKGTSTTPWCCPMSLATDFIVVRQPQAPTSCIAFGFYRCPPASGPYVLHQIGF